MRDHVLQGPVPRENQTTQNDWKRTRAHTREKAQARSRGDSGTGETKEQRERGRPGGFRRRLRVWVQQVRWGQHDRIFRAPRLQISKVTPERSLWNTTSAETKLRLLVMDVLRERKTVRVSWRGRPKALHTIGVKFGREPELGAIWAEMSRAVYELPTVKVRTSAGLRSL